MNSGLGIIVFLLSFSLIFTLLCRGVGSYSKIKKIIYTMIFALISAVLSIILSALLNLFYFYNSKDNAKVEKDNNTTIETNNDAQQQQQQQQQQQMIEKKLSIIKNTEYPKKTYPKLHNELGVRMHDIDSLMTSANILTASSDDCDEIKMNGISELSTISNIVIYTYCSNNSMFRFNESELKDGNGKYWDGSNIPLSKPIPLKKMAMEEKKAVLACQMSTRSSLQYPSSFDSGMWEYDASYDGTATVRVDFTAMNAFGAKLPQLAICEFPVNGKPKFWIQDR